MLPSAWIRIHHASPYLHAVTWFYLSGFLVACLRLSPTELTQTGHLFQDLGRVQRKSLAPTPRRLQRPTQKILTCSLSFHAAPTGPPQRPIPPRRPSPAAPDPGSGFPRRGEPHGSAQRFSRRVASLLGTPPRPRPSPVGLPRRWSPSPAASTGERAAAMPCPQRGGLSSPRRPLLYVPPPKPASRLLLPTPPTSSALARPPHGGLRTGARRRPRGLPRAVPMAA